MFGKHHSKEAKEKIRKAHKGKTLSDNHKKKLSESHKGKISNRKGAILSEKTKEKISKNLKGRIFTEDHRKNLSIALTGKIMSDKAKNILSNRTISEITRIKIGEASKKAHAKRREILAAMALEKMSLLE
jgi:hypothetical protein